MKTMRKGAALLALAAIPFAATPASAHVTVGVVVGTGTISPGLPGCNQRVTFSGTVVLGGGHVGTYSVAFSGSSSGCEDLAHGEGCGTISGGVSGSVCYGRTGNVVQLSGTNIVVGGSGGGHTLTGTCAFAPTSAQPTTTYGLHCDIVLV